MTNALDYYREKIGNLRIDKSKGLAPHKPILLLSIAELIEYNKIPENKIPVTPLVTSTFLKYWSKLNFEKHQSNVSLPFFHLKNDGFWHLQPHKGFERVLEFAKSIRKFSELREIVDYATLDDNLFWLLRDKRSREIIKEQIINSYFPDKKETIREILKETRDTENYQKELVADAHRNFMLIREDESDATRISAFRNSIMSIYNYSCSICKIQLITIDGETIVDAAHIIPFRVSHNNDIRNGLALCKNHHWCFDRGLIAIDHKYRVIVSSLVEERNFLGELEHEKIFLPKKHEFYPAQEAFDWHLRNVLQK
jgi:putative restriction endonuclease